MKINFSLNVARISRIMLGMILTIIGWNYVFDFLPFHGGFDMPAKYMFGLVGVLPYTELITKILILSIGMFMLVNIAVPFLLLLLLPIIVNFMTFQVLYTYNLAIITAISISYLILVIKNYQNFKYLLTENLE